MKNLPGYLCIVDIFLKRAIYNAKEYMLKILLKFFIMLTFVNDCGLFVPILFLLKQPPGSIGKRMKSRHFLHVNNHGTVWS